MMAKHGRRVVSREDGKAAGASAHAARMPGSHTPETRTSFAAVKRTRDADHHARSRLRATMSSSPDHAHSMSVRRGPASCGRRAHGHGGTTCRRECSRRVFCSRDQIFFLDVLFRVHESKKKIQTQTKKLETRFFSEKSPGITKTLIYACGPCGPTSAKPSWLSLSLRCCCHDQPSLVGRSVPLFVFSNAPQTTVVVVREAKRIWLPTRIPGRADRRPAASWSHLSPR